MIDVIQLLLIWSSISVTMDTNAASRKSTFYYNIVLNQLINRSKILQ